MSVFVSPVSGMVPAARFISSSTMGTSPNDCLIKVITLWMSSTVAPYSPKIQMAARKILQKAIIHSVYLFILQLRSSPSNTDTKNHENRHRCSLQCEFRYLDFSRTNIVGSDVRHRSSFPGKTSPLSEANFNHSRFYDGFLSITKLWRRALYRVGMWNLKHYAEICLYHSCGCIIIENVNVLDRFDVAEHVQ